jgi:hypothetical protein
MGVEGFMDLCHILANCLLIPQRKFKSIIDCALFGLTAQMSRKTFGCNDYGAADPIKRNEGQTGNVN